MVASPDHLLDVLQSRRDLHILTGTLQRAGETWDAVTAQFFGRPLRQQ